MKIQNSPKGENPLPVSHTHTVGCTGKTSQKVAVSKSGQLLIA